MIRNTISGAVVMAWFRNARNFDHGGLLTTQSRVFVVREEVDAFRDLAELHIVALCRRRAS